MKPTLLLFLLLAVAPVTPCAGSPPEREGPREETIRHYLAGRWLERAGDRDGALAEYSRALAATPDDAGVLLRLAELSTHDGQPLRTIDYADRVLAIDSSAARAHWLRGAALFQLRRTEEAYLALERAAIHGADQPEILRTLARVAESLSRTERVAQVYAQISGVEPEDAEAWFQRAASEARLGRFALADSLLARSLVLDPIRPGAIFLRAWVHENLGRLESSIADYRQHLQVHVQDDPTRRRVVMLLARSGRMEEALSAAREVAEASPLDPEALVVLADLAYAKGRTRDGADALRRMRGTAPDDPRLVARSIGVLARHQRRREGIELADAWVRRQKAEPDALLLAARAHAALGDAAGAATLARRAAKASPDSLSIRRLLARVLEEAGRPEEAEAEFRSLRQRWPTDIGVLLDLGSLRERRGDLDGAVGAGREALTLRPEAHEAQNFLGYLLADRGRDLEQALALIRSALEADPDNGAYVDSYGWVLFRLGRLEEARVQLERALALTGGDPVIHEHLGDVYTALSLAERAREQYQLSLAADSGNARVRAKLQGAR